MLEVGPGQVQVVVRVPLWLTVRVCAWMPVWPLGHATVRFSLARLREMADELGLGAEQEGPLVHVLLTVIQEPQVPASQPVHAPLTQERLKVMVRFWTMLPV